MTLTLREKSGYWILELPTGNLILGWAGHSRLYSWNSVAYYLLRWLRQRGINS